jgi:hypothetical protein
VNFFSREWLATEAIVFFLLVLPPRPYWIIFGWKQDKRRERSKEAQDGVKEPPTESPFACIGATMGWETFHMLHVVWMTTVDVPATSADKDWDLEVGSLRQPHHAPPHQGLGHLGRCCGSHRDTVAAGQCLAADTGAPCLLHACP